jgi:hypothetical protein
MTCPEGCEKWRSRLSIGFLVAASSIVLLGGCGGSDESGADELARQQELSEARKEAAQDARQSATIERLEQRLNRLKNEEGDEGPQPVPTTTPAPGSSGVDDSSSNLGDWPGGSAYSAMLGAFSSEENARRRQSEATELGLDAGVLYSSNFSSLRPGYWVVFSGAFAGEEEAAARAARARELGYSDSYPRFVSP